MNGETDNAPRKLLWPRFVLAGVVVFLLLSVLWVSREIERIKRYKAAWSSPQTNAPPPPPATPRTDGTTD